ncbi:hypothetical protein ACWCY1_22275 [Streptomyces goshikiensis]|uniref:hypothetical protein n=1 Tax=Streptomyces goshikiensis TaxID=1942 RepID=UPI0036DCD6CF
MTVSSSIWNSCTQVRRSISTAGTWRSRPGVVGWKTACSRRIPSFSILEDLDEDVLAEAAAGARAFGAGPAAAADELVRGLLAQLAD